MRQKGVILDTAGVSHLPLHLSEEEGGVVTLCDAPLPSGADVQFNRPLDCLACMRLFHEVRKSAESLPR